MLRIVLITLLLFGYGGYSAVAAELPTAATLFEQVEGRFNRLQSLSYQVKRTVSSKEQQGEDQWQFRFRQPDRLRIDYLAPQQRLLFHDGKTLLEYLPAARKALRTDLLALGVEQRNALLQGVLGRVAIPGLRLGEYGEMVRSATSIKTLQWNGTAAYLIEGVTPRFAIYIDQQRYVLLRVEIYDTKGKLVMRSDGGSWVEVTRDFWFPREIRITNQTASGYVNSVVHFSDIRVNELLGDDLFRFSAPSGVTIVNN